MHIFFKTRQIKLNLSELFFNKFGGGVPGSRPPFTKRSP